MDKWNSRKLVSAIIAYAGGFALCMLGKLSGGEFVTLATVTIGAYIAAQAVVDHKAAG